MIQPHHFSYKCPLQLSDLDRTRGGYHCSQCRKEIHDLTDCSLDDVRELQIKHGSICGFVRLVGVTSMLSLAACSKGGKDGQAAPAPNEAPKPPENERVLMGDVCVPEPKPTPNPQQPEEQAAPVAPAETSNTDAEPEEPIPPKEVPQEKIVPPPPVLMGVMAPMPEKKAIPIRPCKVGPSLTQPAQ